MSELRFDPVKKIWSVIAVERSRRPIDFLRVEEHGQPHTVSCPFCYGNEGKTPPEISAERSSGIPNSSNWKLRVIPNKYPALGIEGDLTRRGEGMYDVVSGIGAHEIIIESPRHDLRLKQYDEETLVRLFGTFRARLVDLSGDIRFRYILAFKNYGISAGATLEHPHSQIIAVPVLPNMIKAELTSAIEHFNLKERCLFCDLLDQEHRDESRIVYENSGFIAFCPYASAFPFELRVYPKKHSHDFTAITDAELPHLADVMKELFTRLDTVLENPPLNFIIHTAPPLANRAEYREYRESVPHAFHWHIEVVPRLTRIAGFEWGSGFHINPVMPDEAARYLREADR